MHESVQDCDSEHLGGADWDFAIWLLPGSNLKVGCAGA